MGRVVWRVLAIALFSFLSACSGPKYTIDDGRKVDEVLLKNIRTYGAGQNAIRGAIVRSDALKDKGCDKQWELPFFVSSSDELSKDDRVAWVRGLGVDERLTVIGAAPNGPVQLQDKLQEIDGYHSSTVLKMIERLDDRRDSGKPFDIQLSTGKVVKITPFEVCRGRTMLAAPVTPKMQDYHWLSSTHPLEVAAGSFTDDEALWLVLWTQGVSEVGGARMKSYHYGTKIAGTIYSVVSIATGLQGAAMAAQASVAAAQATAATATSAVLRQQLTDQAMAAGRSKILSEVSDSGQKMLQAKVVSTLQEAAANRGSLSGVSWVASTTFENVDVWAFDRMDRLNADPLAGISLHQKLVAMQLASNSMVMDPERLAAFGKFVRVKGRGSELDALLQGSEGSDAQTADLFMPVASNNEFSYEDISTSAKVKSSAIAGFAESMMDNTAPQQNK
jgi:hypothetical protein